MNKNKKRELNKSYKNVKIKIINEMYLPTGLYLNHADNSLRNPQTSGDILAFGLLFTFSQGDQDFLQSVNYVPINPYQNKNH